MVKEQLQRMATGMTGNLDEIYPEVVGPRNGWLGGDGDVGSGDPIGLMDFCHLPIY